ncbi:MAG: hypothetical protein MR394_09125 [Coprococcus comes]|nr:hypothetical protein [Coprococcus comes]
MKNREYRVLVTLALMASLVVGNIAGTSVNVQAADNKDKSTETKKTSETKTSSSAIPAKDETVYVKVDDAGNQKDVTVSDQLKNISSLGTIDDVSDLKDIKNVKGDETFSENNGKLVWQGDKKDICYQGTTTKKIPVGMKVTYELDGKKVSADDLEGKSGHLKIHYEYQNTSADSGKYTPFLMATGLLMDGEKFSNVTVDNGKVISDGDRDIVIGMGLPQLKEQLTSVSSKVDDLDIPDSFTVEADVTDYEKVEAVTVATNDVFNEVGTDKFDSLDELKDSMTELQDASNKLVSGSGELKDGLDTLLSSSGTLVSGIDQLASGGNTLASGTGSLVSGANTLNAGLQTASSKVSGTLLPGVKALDLGVSQMQSKLATKDALPKLTTGVATLDAALNTGNAAEGQSSLVAAAASVDAGVQKAATGANVLSQKVAGSGTIVKSLNEAIKGTAEETENIKIKAKAAKEAVEVASGKTKQEVTINSDNVDVSDVVGTATGVATGTATGAATGTAEVSYDGGTQNAAAIATLQTALTEVEGNSAATEAIQNAINSLQGEQKVSGDATMSDATINDATMSDAIIENANVGTGKATVSTTMEVTDPKLQKALDSLTELMEMTDGVYNDFYSETGLLFNMAKVDSLLNSSTSVGNQKVPSAVETASAVNEGLKELKAGTPALADGINQVAAGATELNEGVNGKDGLVSQVNSGVLQLKSGTAQLLAGVDGTNGLASGLGQLAAGSSQLVSGASQLNSGAGTLSTGLNTLQNSTGALVSGVEQLDSGADELNSGMIQFNEEGIEKLVSVFDGDVDSLLDKANELLDASKEYKNFSGIADGMDGSVKFIFVSDK